MSTDVIADDRRTDVQKKADEAAAAGNWSGFHTEELLTEAGAMEILARSQRAIVGDIRHQPFRWREKVYRVLKCEFSNGAADVEVAPHDETLVAELKRRVASNRFHFVAYCQCFGFACFPEDYLKYQD